MSRDYMELQKSIGRARSRMRAIALARGAALFLGLSLIVVGGAIWVIVRRRGRGHQAEEI